MEKGRMGFPNMGPAGKKSGLSQDPPDGPARVVKPGDWGAVTDPALKGFQMEAFNIPGRLQPKPTPAEDKLAEMAREARRKEVSHKQEMEKAARQAEVSLGAAAAKAREEGLREGEDKAWRKYSEALQQLQSNARNALETLSGEKAALFLAFEGQAVDLAALCVRRVFENLADGPLEAVLPLLRKAVAALGEAHSVTLKVHPADFHTVEENKPFWLPVDAGIKDIRIVPDNRIEKGGCLVECDSTSVEMHASDLATRIEAELERVFEAKVRALQDPRAGISGQVEGDTGEAP